MSSCAFEHVFLGEKQNANDVSGLHNWVFFSTQELTNQLNYMGYVKKIDLNGVSINIAEENNLTIF